MRRSLRLAFIWCLAVVGCLLVGACGGGGTSSNSPTSPTPVNTGTPSPTPAPTNQWVGSGGMDLASASATPNLLVVELRLDGVLEHRHTAAGQPEVLVGTRFVSKRLSPGQHTMTLTIVNQARSPHEYEIVGAASFLRDGTQATSSASCERVRRTLANGDEISCSFTLP